jgi:cobalt transporter subunit CbtB
MGMPVRGASPKSGAAPATVSGEPDPRNATGPQGREGEARAPTREPGDLPSQWQTGTAAGGAAKEAHLNTQTTTTTAGVRSSERSEALVAALVALALGVGLVFTTGFSHPSTIHNAAHDTRHALSFPCH